MGFVQLASLGPWSCTAGALEDEFGLIMLLGILSIVVFFFFFLINLFIFIFGCVGSSLLRVGFL